VPAVLSFLRLVRQGQLGRAALCSPSRRPVPFVSADRSHAPHCRCWQQRSVLACCTRGTDIDIFGATYTFDVIMSCCDVSTDARPPAANRLLLEWSACVKQSEVHRINTPVKWGFLVSVKTWRSGNLYSNFVRANLIRTN
jgi:hypothetical protein